MKAVINDCEVKGLKYKAATKDGESPVGQVVLEFDADEADAADIAALIGQYVRVELESPQLAMAFVGSVNHETGEIG